MTASSNGLPAPLNKVPDVTLAFWLIKVMATSVGETGADYLIFHFQMGLANTSLIVSGALVVALSVQVAFRSYLPWLYWITVVLISIVGTLLTDNLSDALHVPLEVSTVAFSLLLAATFAIWFALEKELVDPHHLHVAARTFLLGRHSIHVCARDRGW